MKLSSQVLDASRSLLLEWAPWASAFLPSLRGTALRVRFSKDRIAIIDRRRLRQIWIARANAVYLADMVSSFDYYFTAVEPFRQAGAASGYQVVDYSSSRFHKVSGFVDFPILCPSLAEPYQTCEQYLEFAQLKEGQTVFDLGCYSGLTAIAFSKAVKEGGRVVSLEPDPINFTACVQNFDLHRRVNGLQNISLLPVAVSGASGTLTFSSEGSMGSSAVSVVGGNRGAVIEIACVTLDDLLKQSGVAHVNFIKMDIEGSELDVVRNAGPFLRTHRPRLIIEPHVVNGQLNAGALIDCLTGYGYRCTAIEQFGTSLPLVTAIPE